MAQLIVFLALAFSIVIAVFAVSNTDPIRISFLTFQSPPVAAAVLVLISVALGAAAMVLHGEMEAADVIARIAARGADETDARIWLA